MHAEHVVVDHRLLLPRVGMHAVRHDSMIRPQAEFLICLPILLAIGVQLMHQLNLALVFAQMGLHEDAALRRNFAEPAHQLIGAARRKARGQDWADAGKLYAFVQPAQGFAFALLRQLLTFAACAIHVHFADKAAHARFFQLFHQDQRRVRVRGRIDANPRGAVFDKLRGKAGIHLAREAAVRKARFGFEGIGLEPVHQRQIHAHAEHRILRRVQMHVRKTLQD
ncbi:hypothetical protein SDC9_101579 [bioreactor metagenome]|uniref:Uncharacterized protein n=1 Tax=bioreactor metagenome TaxID=1076179 RepID=A0A645ANP9_9ZZZZ